MVVDIQGCGVQLFDPEVQVRKLSQIMRESSSVQVASIATPLTNLLSYISPIAFVSYWIRQFYIRSVGQFRSI